MSSSWRELRISWAMMAHPGRELQAREIADEIHRQLPEGESIGIVWDQVNNRWDTGSRAQERGLDSGADWHVVIQDDVILAGGFVNQVRQALHQVAEGPVAFYMGRGHLEGVKSELLVRRVQRARYRWLKAYGPLWGPCVAIRPADIGPMLEWCDKRKDPKNYDLRMALYFRSRGRSCWYSMPCLVEHRTGDDNPSLVAGRGSSRGRRAAWFMDKPWKRGDWTDAALELTPDRPRLRGRQVDPAPVAEGGDRVCAILMPAFRAFPYMAWALESIEDQLELPGWRYELRIAVDGCPSTAAGLGALGRSFHWSQRNVGPYILRNSLAALAPADAYATFDADDEMKPEYLRTLIPLACPDEGEPGIAGSRRLEHSVETSMRELRIRTKPLPYCWGISVYSRTAWEALGGFRPWRIAADHDLYHRARAKQIPVHQHHGLPKALYYRRLHAGSLTADPTVGMNAPERIEKKAVTHQLIEAGELAVKPETIDLELVEPWRP